MNNSDIYNNPDVYQIEQTGGLEKPVHTDIRGSIHRINIDGFNVIMLSTKAGFMRAGDLHKNIQFDFIFSGKIEIWFREGDKDTKKIYKKNDFLEIPPHTPHLFNFLEDTVMAEWQDEPFEIWYYKPYREKIDEQFKKMTSGS